MTPTIEHLAPTVVAVVGLAEEATEVEITKDGWLRFKDKMGVWGLSESFECWQIVGWSDELNEATCAGLVDREEEYSTLHDCYLHGYKDYSSRWNIMVNSATESFASLLRSHGIEGRALILCRID